MAGSDPITRKTRNGPPKARLADAAIGLLGQFSMEMTTRDLEELERARDIIPRDTSINITHLAGDTVEARVKAVHAVRQSGFVPVVHIAARRVRSRLELDDLLFALHEADALERIFIVSGDPSKPAGPYPDAVALIRCGLLEQFEVGQVGIAGYPDGHPDIPDSVLWKHLDDKLGELGLRGMEPFLLTQFCFDSTIVARWIRAVRDRGHNAPIRVGVPGPAGIKRLLAYARRFGVSTNTMVIKKYGISLSNLLVSAGPGQFIERLASELTSSSSDDDVGLHLYTFGGLHATAEWVELYTSACIAKAERQ